MTEELKQLQKQEALKRLKILQSKYGLPEYVVREFAESGTKYYSEHDCYKMKWCIHPISSDKDFESVINEFEINNDVLVYYAIFETPTNDGLELGMLYVSEDKWEWKKEIQELIEGYPLAYYKNFDYDNESKYLYEPISYISFN